MPFCKNDGFRFPAFCGINHGWDSPFKLKKETPKGGGKKGGLTGENARATEPPPPASPRVKALKAPGRKVRQTGSSPGGRPGFFKISGAVIFKPGGGGAVPGFSGPHSYPENRAPTFRNLPPCRLPHTPRCLCQALDSLYPQTGNRGLFRALFRNPNRSFKH